MYRLYADRSSAFMDLISTSQMFENRNDIFHMHILSKKKTAVIKFSLYNINVGADQHDLVNNLYLIYLNILNSYADDAILFVKYINIGYWISAGYCAGRSSL